MRYLLCLCKFQMSRGGISWRFLDGKIKNQRRRRSRCSNKKCQKKKTENKISLIILDLVRWEFWALSLTRNKEQKNKTISSLVVCFLFSFFFSFLFLLHSLFVKLLVFFFTSRIVEFLLSSYRFVLGGFLCLFFGCWRFHQ